MIEFGGVYYTFNLEAFNKTILIDDNSDDEYDKIETIEETNDSNGLLKSKTITTTTKKSLQIDSSKYAFIDKLIDVILDDIDIDADDTLGPDRALAKFNLSYKIAFNTLISYGILVKTEVE